MVLQPSAIGSLPQMISFILSGRRTLSEHLPAEIVDVPSAVVQRSTYLRNFIVQQKSTYSTTWQFSLPNVDPIGFRMYIEWLETRHIELQDMTLTSRSGGVLLRDAFDFMFAHIAGSQLEELDFQDYMIDIMNDLLDVSQTPDLKVLEVVFLENGASNVLKQFIVDKMFAVERTMLGMMRGRVDDPEERGQETGCKYHVHAAGECYRNHLKDIFGNGANNSHASRQKSHSNRHPDHSDRPNSTSSTSRSGGSLNLTFYDSKKYNMAYGPYFGSEEWSREVHGLQRRGTILDLHNKPLPNIPPLTPGSSPTPLLSPRSFPISFSPDGQSRPSDVDSTQQLIFECLSRLPTTDDSLKGRAESEPDLHRTQIPGLVLECLERFKNSHSDEETSGTESSTRVSFPYTKFDCWPLPTLQEQSSSPVQSSHAAIRCSSPEFQEHFPPWSPAPVLMPGAERRVHWVKSYETLPKPWLDPGAQIAETSQTHLEVATQQGYATVEDYSAPLIERADSALVKRKNAPSRGTDWLKQYDRVNDLMRDAPPVVAKRSKRSKFKEMLLSESRLGGKLAEMRV